MSVSVSISDDDMVPPEIVSTIFYSATVSDSLAILVAEVVAGGGHRLTWGNEGAAQLLGYGVDDLYGGHRERSAQRPWVGLVMITSLDGSTVVDSVFQMSFRIEYKGAKGSKLEGLSGTSEGKVTMRAVGSQKQ